MNPLPAGLLVVTDRHQATRPLPALVAGLLASGARWIWLRDRDLPVEERRALAVALLSVTRQAGAALSIGADIALAGDIGAAGVHLRSAAEVGLARAKLGTRAVLGVSAHSVHEVQEAAAAGADYVTLSPIFASASKPGYGPALGPQVLGEAATLGIPVLALGGVTAGTAAVCRAVGAAGIAIMGPAMRSTESSAILKGF